MRIKEISEAYATLSVGNLRRRYDTGEMGQSYSARDMEQSRHKVDNEAFFKGRTEFKEQYGDGSRTSSGRQNHRVSLLLNFRQDCNLK